MDIDLAADPAVAAALFERAVPHLDTPRAVVFEGCSLVLADPGTAIEHWLVGTPLGVFRMKVAATDRARERLARGARVTRALHRRGLTVPEPLGLSTVDRVGVAVAVEKRLGTTDARAAWRALGPSGRENLEERLAGELLRLHAIGPGDLDDAGDVPSAPPWEEILDDPRARSFLPPDVHERASRLIRRGLSAGRPPCVALCHGRLTPQTVAVARRSFAGLLDFEDARWGDPREDLVTFAFGRAATGVADVGTLASTYLGSEVASGEAACADAWLGLAMWRDALAWEGETLADSREIAVASLVAWAQSHPGPEVRGDPA